MEQTWKESQSPQRIWIFTFAVSPDDKPQKVFTSTQNLIQISVKETSKVISHRKIQPEPEAEHSGTTLVS